MCVPKNSLNRRGFAMVGIVIAMAMIPTLILIGIQIASHVKYANAAQRSLETRSRLMTLQNWVIGQAKDADGDTYYEPLKDGASNTLPASPVPPFTKDAYGQAFKYCAWDLGAVNTDATYSQNNAAPPIAGLIASVISSGADGVFQTACTDTIAKGDDQWVLITDTAVKYGGVGTASGWTTDGTNVSLANPAGQVLIPTAPSTVNSAVNKAYVDSVTGGGGNSLVRVARTSNTILAAADKGKLIDITSGTFTQTFNAAATLGNGWFVYIRNAGTGDITLDPSGAEAIDGLTSYIMYPGEVRLIQCDGTALRSIVLQSFYKVFTSTGIFVKPPGYHSFEGIEWGAGASGQKGPIGAIRFGGGSGACALFRFLSSQLSSSETVTIGSGGVAVTVDGGSNPGGDTEFNGIIAYGAIATRGGSAYVIGATISTNAAIGSSNLGGSAGYLGGTRSTSSGTEVKAIYASGHGGSIDNNGFPLPAGTSVFSAEGGAASSASNGSDGTAPGGGGGATNTGAQSGAGARGECRIWGVL